MWTLFVLTILGFQPIPHAFESIEACRASWLEGASLGPIPPHGICLQTGPDVGGEEEELPA